MLKYQRRSLINSSVLRFWFALTVFAIIVDFSLAKSTRRKDVQINHKKQESQNALALVPSESTNNNVAHPLTVGKPTTKRTKQVVRKTRFARSSLRTSRRHKDPRTQIIKEAILTLPELYELLAPIKWYGSLDGVIGPSDYGHLRGTVRLKRLYCRVGIGYHLEIDKKGIVKARHTQTSDGIMEIFSVKRRVVGIRSVAHRDRYLCMNKAGRVYTRRRFQPSCEFRENLEGNRFNTYASERFSNHEKREGYFLAINKSGKLPRKMKRVSWKQKKAHWLPLSV